MAGVIIDIDTKSESAKQDLRDINRGLADMVRSSTQSGRALDSISGTKLKDINSAIKQNTSSMEAFRNTSTSTATSVNHDAASISKTIESVKRSIETATLSLVAFGALKAFNTQGDNLTLLQNKLKLVTKNSEELLSVQRKLYAISGETRSSFEGSAGVFASFSKSLAQTGASSDKVLKITRTIQQAGALSSGSVESLNLALIQLGQGLSAGVLRGQDFHSVVEQFDYLAKELPKALGTTNAGLRKMANEGKLTTEVLVKAFENMAKSTDADFGKTVITTGAAFQVLRQNVGYFVGDVNQYLGVSTKFAKVIVGLASSFQFGSDSVVQRLSLLKNSFRNYFQEFDAFGDKAVSDTNARASRYQEALRRFFSKGQDVSKNKTGKVNASKSEDDSFFALKNTKKSVRSALDLGLAAADTIGVTFKNIANLTPNILGPQITYFHSFIASLAKFNNEGINEGNKVLRLKARLVRSLAEPLSLYSLGDTRVPRAAVNLFKSDNIKDFTANLNKLNRVREKIRLEDRDYVGNEVVRSLKQATYGTQEFLIKLGVLDNQLIRVRDTKFDRLVQYSKTVFDTIRLLYTDVFKLAVQPILYNLKINLLIIFKTLADSIQGQFTSGFGERVAKSFGAGVAASVRGIFHLIKFTDNPGAFKSFFDGLNVQLRTGFVEIFSAVKEFSKGFGKGFLEGVGIDPGPLVQKFKFLTAQIRIAVDYIRTLFVQLFQAAQGPLKRVEAVIHNFGERVKRIFYDIWDAVVGHSYWPDTINGVVDYTHKIFAGHDILAKFKDGAIKIFEQVYSNVKGFAQKFAVPLEQFKLRIKGVDWGDALKQIANSLGVIIVGAFILLTGEFGGKLTLAAYSFFFSLFNGVLDGALSTLAPGFGLAAGVLAGHFVQRFVSSTISYLKIGLAALPSFIEGFFQGLLPSIISGPINAITNAIPLFTNKIIQALALLSLAYGIFAKKGFQNIAAVLFGDPKKGGGFSIALSGIVEALRTSLFSLPAKISIPISVANKFSGKLIGNLFNNKLIAAAAFAAMASSLSETFSLMDGLGVAYPLLAVAILGKDGGLRFIRETLRSVSVLFSSILFKIAGIVKQQVAPAGSTLASIFDLPQTIWNKITNRAVVATGVIGRSFKTLRKDISEVVENIATNRALYGNGTRSLSDTLLKGNSVGPKGPQLPRVTNISKSASNFANTVIDAKLAGGRSARSFIDPIIDNTKLGLTTLGLAIESFIPALKNSFGSVGRTFGEFFNLLSVKVTGGFGGLVGSFLKNKFALAALALTLVTAFSGVANASTTMDAGIAGSNASLSQLHSSLIAVGIALAGIAVILSKISSYKSANAAFKDIVGNKQINGSAVGAGLKSAFSRELSLFGGGKPKEGSRRFIGPSVPGEAEIGPSFIGGYNRKSKANIATGAGVIANVNAKLTDMFSVSALFKKSASYFGTSITSTAGLIKVAGSAILLGAEGLLTTLAPFIATGALIAGIIASVVVAFGLLLGPFESITDNLKFLADKVSKLLGFGNITNAGSQSDASKAGNGEVAGQKIDFTKQVLNLDYSKISDEQQKAIEESLTSTKEAFKNLNELYLKQGFLTDAQKQQLKQTIDEQKNLLGRQPVKDNKDITLADQVNNDAIRRKGGIDNSIGTRILRASGSDSKGLLGEETALPSKVLDYLNNKVIALDKYNIAAGKEFKESLVKGTTKLVKIGSDKFYGSDFVKTVRTATADPSEKLLNKYHEREVGFTTKLSGVTKGLSEDQLKKIEDLREESGKAVDVIADKLRRNIQPTSREILRAERLEKAYKKGSLAATKIGTAKVATDKFQESRKSFAVRNTDLGLDTLGTDFLGNKKDALALDKLQDLHTKSVEAGAKAFSSAEAAKQAAVQKSTLAIKAAYYEQIKASSEVGTQLAQQGTAVGDGASAASILRLKLTGGKTADAFESATTNYLHLQSAFEHAPLGTPTKALNDLYDAAQAAKIALVRLAPGTISLEELSTALSTLNAGGLTQLEYINLPTQDVLALSAGIKAVKLASEAAARALSAVGSDTNNIETYKQKLRELRNEMAGVKATASKSLVDSYKEIDASGLTGTARYQQKSEAAGETVNDQVVNKGAADRASKLLDKIAQGKADRDVATKRLAAAQSAVGLGQAFGFPLKVKPQAIKEINTAVDKATKSISKADLALKKLEEAPQKDKFGFKELLIEVNKAGIAISDLGFAQLTFNSRKALQTLAAELHKIDKLLEKAKPTDNVVGLLNRRAQLYAQSRRLLLDSIGNTGESLSKVVADSGADPTAKLSVANVQKLVRYEKELTELRTSLDAPTSAKKFLEIQERIRDIEKSRVEFLKNITGGQLERKDIFLGFDDQIRDAITRGAQAGYDKLKEIFAEFRLTPQEYRRVPREQRDAVSKEAIASDTIGKLANSKDLTSAQAAVLSKYSDPSNSATDIIKEFNDTFQGKLVSLIGTPQEKLNITAEATLKVLEDIRDSNKGLSYNNVKTSSVAPTDAEVRKAVAEAGGRVTGGARTQARTNSIYADGKFHRSNHVPGTTPGIQSVDVAPLYGKARTDFEANLRKLNLVIKRVIDETKQARTKSGRGSHLHYDLANATQDSKVDTSDVVTVTANKIAAATQTEVSNGALDRLDKYRRDGKDGIVDAAKSAGNFRQGSQIQLNDKPIVGFDQETFNKATNKELVKAVKFSEDLDKLSDKIRVAQEKGDPAVTGLQFTFDALTRNAEIFTDKIKHKGDEARDAGKRFAESIDGSFRDAFFGLLTGKKFDLKGILNTFTDGILNNVVDGFTNALTGKNGIFSKLFEKLGGGIFGGAEKGGGQIGDKLTSASDSTGLSGLANRLFSPKASPEASPLGGIASGILGTPSVGGILGGIAAPANGPGIFNSGPVAGSGLGNAFGADSGQGIFSAAAPVAGGILGGLGKGFGKGASTLTSGVVDGAVSGATDLAKGVSDGATEGAKKIGDSLKGAGKGGKFDVGALAGTAGSLLGTLIGSFFADGGKVSTGGAISGPGSGTSDSILAMVSNDEHIIKAKQAKKYRPLLNAINNDTLKHLAIGGRVGGYSSGGIVGASSSPTIDPSKLSQPAKSSTTVVNLGITGNIDKQTRANIYEMLPSIAQGVNGYNRENGYR
jgi:tape measure domain-containing protein